MVHLLFRNQLLSQPRNSPQLMRPENSLKYSGVEEEMVTDEGRKVHKDVLYDLYPSLHIIRVIKTRRKWQGM
jgi:hypothetical protein